MAISFERLLLNEGLVTPEQLALIKKGNAQTGNGFIPVALDEGILSFEALASFLYQYAKIESVDLMAHELPADAGTLGHFHSAKYCCLPVKQEKNRLWVAMRDPLHTETLLDLADITGLFIEPLLACGNDILFHINTLFGREQIHSIASEHIAYPFPAPQEEPNTSWQTAPSVRLIDSLIETGVLNRASDIHIEPYNRQLRTRYRADGQLHHYQMLDAALLPNVISRLKVMGGMDIAEKRLPQDGHFSLTVHGEAIDFRLSTLPTLYGEKAVLRLLYSHATRLHKDELGFFPDDMKKLDQLFSQPYGAIFMTGPTGSGKSTTLNSFLETLNKENVNIITVEDPVENPLPGINHLPIEPAAGFGFANALRYILRQDPDIIMIGEIRDAETARIAIQAALTGHLVLSTLHTNDAAGVIERLADMGVEPYLAAAALNGVLAQRLVRRICRYCKIQTKPTDEEVLLLSIPPDSPVYTGKGCVRCNHTGYKGRFAIYESIIMDENLRRKMSLDPNGFAAGLRQRKDAGLMANGIRNIAAGNTTPSEIIRALYRDILV